MMEKGYLLCCLLVLVCFVSSYEQRIDESFFKAFPSANRKAMSYSPIEEVEASEKSTYVEPSYHLTACEAVPLPAPTDDINKLQPGHIKVVTAMGDSITRGHSAKDTSVVSLKQYGGISFAIGGDAGIVTMPNLLRQYSPFGFPVGVSTGVGLRDNPGNGLNAAVSGSINVDLLGQAEWLVEHLKARHDLDYEKDWKLLTLWMGSNNLCVVCNNFTANNGDNFENNVLLALEYLYKNVPRLFVNLLPNLDITQMYDYKTGLCNLLHGYECPCATSSNAANRNLVKEVAKDYYVRSTKIAANFKARNNPQFAVVVQPFLTQSAIFNRSYLSAADCFHPSAIAHDALSVALWNAMVVPAAQKKFAWNIDERPICATNTTFIYTS